VRVMRIIGDVFSIPRRRVHAGVLLPSAGRARGTCGWRRRALALRPHGPDRMDGTAATPLRRRLAVPGRARPGRPLLRLEVDVHEAEARAVPVAPLEVVHRAPHGHDRLRVQRRSRLAQAPTIGASCRRPNGARRAGRRPRGALTDRGSRPRRSPRRRRHRTSRGGT
jgi:hypothetical protein